MSENCPSRTLSGVAAVFAAEIMEAAVVTDERFSLSDPASGRICVSVAASAHLFEDALHDLITLALGGSADGVEQSF